MGMTQMVTPRPAPPMFSEEKAMEILLRLPNLLRLTVDQMIILDLRWQWMATSLRLELYYASVDRDGSQKYAMPVRFTSTKW